MDYLGVDTINASAVRGDVSKTPNIIWALGYTDGQWPDFVSIAAQNPNIIVEGCSAVDADNDMAHWIDCEAGDFTAQTAVARCVRKIKTGRPSGIYTSRSNAPTVSALWVQEATANKLPPDAIEWMIADWTGYPHLYTSSELGIAGVVRGVQFAGNTPLDGNAAVDLDWLSGSYINQMLALKGTKPMPSNLVMVDIALTPTGKGYWLLRSDGAIYSFGDAKYLGGANTAPIPSGSNAVGITATASGQGYVIVLDTGQCYAYGDAQYEGGHTPAGL